MGISADARALLDDVFADVRTCLDGSPAGTPGAARRLLTYGRQDTRELGETPEAVFAALGFPVADSLDVTGAEGCTIVHDLNDPVPARLHGAYDCVYDGGTMEHVFDVKSVLFNTHNLARPGGVVVHAVPVNNWINHGFYQFSPTLLYGFYGANGYRMSKIFLAVDAKGTPLRNRKFVEVTGEQITVLGLTARLVLPQTFTPNHTVTMNFIAQKPAEHRPPVVPQQPFYDPRYADATFAPYKQLIRL
ncbi:MAG: hypothetical protein SFV21_12945 [Rhodospirillaceae bacterium]|nr:hypothetical protein [Rhodospirillaceae bacterium]